MHIRVLLAVCLVLVSGAFAQDFTQFKRTQAVIDILVNEHQLERDVVLEWMRSGTYHQTSVTSLAAPAETTKTYIEYKPMFLSSATIRAGQIFLRQHEQHLLAAEEKYGVPMEVITAIIGIESRYGRSKGRHKTFDALGSLAVTEGRRADYFQREWIKFIVTMQGLGKDPLAMKGSYAGATGYPQFMPTSYEAYAVDHDNDGDINIWDDEVDAIGSVANYLKENGWRRGEPIMSEANVGANGETIKINSFSRDRKIADVLASQWTINELFDTTDYVFPIRLDTQEGPKYWLGYRNFWSISRYNRSVSYAMAVVQLSAAIGALE